MTFKKTLNKFIFNLSFIFFTCCFMTACKEDLDYQTLMTHPKLLEREITRCQTTKSTFCDSVVAKAQEDFDKLANEWRLNPEDFGKNLLIAQLDLVNKLDALDKAKKNNQPAKDEEIAYQNQLTKVKISLAVVESMSVE